MIDTDLAAPPDFPLTRQAALDRLADFLPHAGADYAANRNFDHGSGQHSAVSRLSAALRRRLISEQHVVHAAIERHGFRGAEKFVSEVFWRTYWKGWLEQRPSIWRDYQALVAAFDAERTRDDALDRRYREAIEGRTGIDCFDHWVRELNDTGYLHNWSRMQVASIWTFTLRLPWALGADWTLSRFIDGDPASNTLSWRWVAGLHTAGKAYFASTERIALMTRGRFHPQGLAASFAVPPEPLPPATPLRQLSPPATQVPALLLITAEDLSLETEPLVAALPIRAIATLKRRNQWDEIAIADAARRAELHWQLPVTDLNTDDPVSSAVAVAQSNGCGQVVTAFAPIGPTADQLAEIRAGLDQAGLLLAEHLRDWDRRAWPHCRRGFFALKETIPDLLTA
ncbi:FAD-binding domain-containing protein [Sphingomonas sp. GlSt437]|uniref:FAD-binding domain-containing protein n=1 Tax=Sphingomonas sp. GlSt437 TaxID=3389970 RepID=UPI003A83EA4E